LVNLNKAVSIVKICHAEFISASCIKIILMILTTTNSIENFKIVDYLGIVTGVALAEEKIVMGFSMSKYLNSIRNSVDATKEKAFQQLQENAKKLNANAVVGIKVEIELMTSNYAMVSVTGTAVKVAA
jgi:uncharacterized protein YbjQ (UPF0145 family)